MERTPRPHLSQFEYVGAHADPDPLRLHEGDYAVCKLLNPEVFKTLPAPAIHALVDGGNYTWFANRLARLAREPHSYLKRHQVALKHAIYSRTRKGDLLVNEQNPIRPSEIGSPAHQFIQDMVRASIQLGVKNDLEFRLLHWPELRDYGWTERGEHKSVPDDTATSRDPWNIELRDYDGKVVGHSKGDGGPMRLSHPKGGQLFILTTEIDRNTEPGESDKKRRSIKEKLLKYKIIFDRKNNHYFRHYGFPNSILPIVTTSEANAKYILELSKKYLGSATWLVVYHWKDWYNERSYSDFSDYIFTATGRRPGQPDFRLNKFWE